MNCPQCGKVLINQRCRCGYVVIQPLHPTINANLKKMGLERLRNETLKEWADRCREYLAGNKENFLEREAMQHEGDNEP